ncbi:hypothetical protein C5468_06840 [Photorhabdus luminescens subsp. mexicana]|uniref:Uncharacterized protein n=1 Tax=Photorhabdus luminescens subsp. mexicana TaxID=2100167 RepID=A0A4R4JH20_PHOLU|nr:hypothetical protein C5468_06840 [Photorhabdus luminescens subsp. mexicana]
MTLTLTTNNYFSDIPVIFQVASLLAALTHPGHIVIYAPGDSLPYRRDAKYSFIHCSSLIFHLDHRR